MTRIRSTPTSYLTRANWVKGLVGVELDEDEITRAAGIVEIDAAAEIDAELNDFDAKNLAKAIAYQAAWMRGQVDPFARHDVSSISQDGIGLSYRDTAGQSDGVILAPLAIRCIARLSWRRGGVFSVGGNRPRGAQWAGFTTDDDCGDWTPFGGGT